MALKLGVHTGPQDLSMEELLKIWRRADETGFHWASVWDHFYANPLESRDNPCFEGVASMAALAGATKNIRVGCLVFCALFRSPGILAKAAVTIDHLSQGRAEIGVGAGWFEEEFREFGYGFPSLGERLSQLEEALPILNSLWRDPVTNFKGNYYEIEGAVCSPKPVNPNMRLWVGGRGQKRTPRIAAKHAGGFNMPYLPPDGVKDRLERLARECDKLGRDPDELDTSVNVGFYMSATANEPDKQPGMPTGVDGAIVGSPQRAIDRLGEYEAAGIKGVNIAFRPPVDWDAFEAYIEEVLPQMNA